MKKNLIKLISLLAFLTGCKTTYIDQKTGDRNPTHNTVHFRNVYKKEHGFWAGGKWVSFTDEKGIRVNGHK